MRAGEALWCTGACAGPLVDVGVGSLLAPKCRDRPIRLDGAQQRSAIAAPVNTTTPVTTVASLPAGRVPLGKSLKWGDQHPRLL